MHLPTVKVRIGLALSMALLLVTACESAPSQGLSTETESTSMNPGLFEPCDIPPEAIQAAGLVPTSKDEDFAGVERSGWEACAWDSGTWYDVTVLSTTHSFDEVKRNPNSTEIRPAPVPGRVAVTYLDISDRKREVCDVAFAIAVGSMIVRAGKKGSAVQEEDSCLVAVRTAISLNGLLPG